MALSDKQIDLVVKAPRNVPIQPTALSDGQLRLDLKNKLREIEAAYRIFRYIENRPPHSESIEDLEQGRALLDRLQKWLRSGAGDEIAAHLDWMAREADEARDGLGFVLRSHKFLARMRAVVQDRITVHESLKEPGRRTGMPAEHQAVLTLADIYPEVYGRGFVAKTERSGGTVFVLEFFHQVGGRIPAVSTIHDWWYKSSSDERLAAQRLISDE